MTEAKAEPAVEARVKVLLGKIRDRHLGVVDGYSYDEARDDVGFLLDEIERLRAQLAEARAQLDAAQPQPTPSECGYVIPLGSWKSRVCRLPQGHDGEHAPSEQTTETK